MRSGLATSIAAGGLLLLSAQAGAGQYELSIPYLSSTTTQAADHLGNTGPRSEYSVNVPIDGSFEFSMTVHQDRPINSLTIGVGYEFDAHDGQTRLSRWTYTYALQQSDLDTGVTKPIFDLDPIIPNSINRHGTIYIFGEAAGVHNVRQSIFQSFAPGTYLDPILGATEDRFVMTSINVMATVPEPSIVTMTAVGGLLLVLLFASRSRSV